LETAKSGELKAGDLAIVVCRDHLYDGRALPATHVGAHVWQPDPPYLGSPVWERTEIAVGSHLLLLVKSDSMKYTDKWISKCWIVLHDGRELAIDERNLDSL
jgi:hypothetical protein